MQKFIFQIIALLFSSPIRVLADSGEGECCDHMGANGAWGGATFFGGFFMIFLWVAIVALVVFLLKAFSNGGKGSDLSAGQEGAEEIIKKRYAKGEITKEEFEKMKKDLS